MKKLNETIVAFFGLASFLLMFAGPAIAILFGQWALALQLGVGFFLIFLLCVVWDGVSS